MPKRKKKQRIPQSSEAKAARQALIAADLVGWESDRQRLSSLTRGSYTGAPRLRSAGAGIRSRYRVGKPAADKGYRGYFGLGNRKRRGKKLRGRAKAGSGKAMLMKVGGTKRDLKLWRRLGQRDRMRIRRQVSRGGNIKRLTRARFDR